MSVAVNITNFIDHELLNEVILAPVVIKSEQDYRKALASLRRIMGQEVKVKNKKYHHAIISHIKSLAQRISDFEACRYRFTENLKGSDFLQFLIEENSLNKSELSECLRSVSYINMILAGRRPISLKNAKKLGEFFSVNPTLFLDL